MKTDLEVIDEVIETLTPEVWAQRTWCVPPGSAMRVDLPGVANGWQEVRNDSPVTKMCVDGVLRQVIWGTPDWGLHTRDDYLDQYERIFALLKMVINDHHEDYWTKAALGSCDLFKAGDKKIHNPMSFNDSHPYEDVQLMLKYTREELEKEL